MNVRLFCNPKFIIINVATVAIIALIGFNKSLCKLLNEHIIFNLTTWSFTHFFYHSLFGYMFPDQFMCLLLMGVAWELFEFSLGMLDSCFNISKRFKDEGYWYGRWSDILMNTLGFTVGYALQM